MSKPKIAITHASSILAEAILEKLPETGLPAESIVLLDNEAHVGIRLGYSGTYLSVQDQMDYDYSECSLVLMLENEEQLLQNLSHLDVVVLGHKLEAEGNPVFAAHRDSELDISYTQRIIKLVDTEQACLLGILPLLHQSFTITRVNAVFMRSAEAKGKAGVDELASQAVALFSSKEVKPRLYPLQIAFNLLPDASNPDFNRELPGLIGDENIQCTHQIVDIPVFHGISAAIQLDFATDISPNAFKSTLEAITNVQLKTTVASPVSDCNQSFNCVISQLEQAQQQTRSIQFWMIADPLRYGLSNNYVNVTDILLESFL
jgi:aspartate-semialdehyde dehydrogenase